MANLKISAASKSAAAQAPRAPTGTADDSADPTGFAALLSARVEAPADPGTGTSPGTGNSGNPGKRDKQAAFGTDGGAAILAAASALAGQMAAGTNLANAAKMGSAASGTASLSGAAGTASGDSSGVAAGAGALGAANVAALNAAVAADKAGAAAGGTPAGTAAALPVDSAATAAVAAGAAAAGAAGPGVTPGGLKDTQGAQLDAAASGSDPSVAGLVGAGLAGAATPSGRGAGRPPISGAEALTTGTPAGRAAARRAEASTLAGGETQNSEDALPAVAPTLAAPATTAVPAQFSNPGPVQGTAGRTLGTDSGPSIAAAAPSGAGQVRDATIQLSTPITSPQWPQEFARTVAVSIRNGVQSAEIHIEPRDLGPISLSVTMNGSSAAVNMVAAHADTRALLQSSLGQLRDALNASGIQLSGASVQGGSADQRGQGGYAGAGDNYGRGGLDTATGPGTAATTAPAGAAQGTTPTGIRRLVDTFA
jgi:flagellar hook-length control protein FliK